MTFEVHLTVSSPRAQVAVDGDLGVEAAAMLTGTIASARMIGCRRIDVHLDGAGTADKSFVKAMSVLGGQCASDGVSLNLEGLGSLAGSSDAPRLRVVPTATAGEEAHG